MNPGVFVYLSGPISAKDGVTVEDNVAMALRWFLDCLRAGKPAFCPHLGAIFPSVWTAIDYEGWMAYDFAVIDRCTHMLMLPRWQASAGACREKAYAEAKGIPIVYDIAAIQGLAVTPSPLEESHA